MADEVAGAAIDREARPDGDADLVERAMAGDRDAFRQIVRRHDSDMLRLAYTICGDREAASDAVQTAWRIAWTRLGSLRDRSRLRSWLLSISANEARQAARRERRWLPNALPHPRFEDDPEGGIAAWDLDAVLARLRPDERELLGLRYVIGFNATEIAAQLGHTPTAVRSRLKRLLDRLREELDDG